MLQRSRGRYFQPIQPLQVLVACPATLEDDAREGIFSGGNGFLCLVCFLVCLCVLYFIHLCPVRLHV